MNNKRRDTLRKAIETIDVVRLSIESVLDEEGDSLNNFPENLQMSDRYVSIENAVDCLDDAVDNLQQATESISHAIDC